MTKEKIFTAWDYVNDEPLFCIRFWKKLMTNGWINDLHAKGEFDTNINDGNVYTAPYGSWITISSEIKFYNSIRSISSSLLEEIKAVREEFESEPLYFSGRELREWYC